MTLAKPASNGDINLSTADVSNQQHIALENKLDKLSTQTADRALHLWVQYQPAAREKGQAVWQLMSNTQPIQLLLTAALAVLAIALVTLVSTFNGLIILFLKLTALVLAAVAVGHWIVRGLSWANKKLPSAEHTNEPPLN